MIWLVVTTLLISLTAVIYTRWLKVKRFWAERGVPYLPPHPIYGSLTFLQKINTAVWMRQMYDRFQSPYHGIWLFWRPSLVVNCPEIARNILVKDSEIFRDRFLSSDSHDPIGSLNIFTAKGPYWSNVRRRLTPFFTSAKLKAVQHLLNQNSKELVQRLAMESIKGRFNIKEPFNDYTTEVIGCASFGIKGEATLTGNSPIRRVTKDFEKYSFFRGIAWSCIFFFPELVKPFGFTFFPKEATDFFRKIFDIIVEQRKQNLDEKSEPRDLLDILLKMKKDMAAENHEISNDVFVSQAAILVQGGFDTTGSQLAFSTYELAHHPDIQVANEHTILKNEHCRPWIPETDFEGTCKDLTVSKEKLYNEIKTAKDKLEGADFDESTLSDITYLNCVIKESLRKYPPMGWLDRISSKDYAIDDKLSIPAGTSVYVNAYGMHYDPKYFPDPNRFNPDRFLPENEINIKKFTYLPFGAGPRICIGQRFGLASLRTVIATIILNYELRPFPTTPKPTEVQIEKTGLFLTPGQPLYIDFVPRN